MWRVTVYTAKRSWSARFHGNADQARARYSRELRRVKGGHVFLIDNRGQLVRWSGRLPGREARC